MTALKTEIEQALPQFTGTEHYYTHNDGRLIEFYTIKNANNMLLDKYFDHLDRDGIIGIYDKILKVLRSKMAMTEAIANEIEELRNSVLNKTL